MKKRMARKQVTVCDVCGRVGRPTTRYRVTREELRATIELCSEHARPLEGLLSKVEAHRARPLRDEDTIISWEELQERKAKMVDSQ